jgi:hypothetical protein
VRCCVAVLAGSGVIGLSGAAAGAVGTAGAVGSAPVAAPVGRVVVIGVPGLRWDDVSAQATPALWALGGQSAIGSLSVKAADPVSCPLDGWLTLGAGNRATAELARDCNGAGEPVVQAGDGATVTGFAGLARRNRSRTDATHLGLLADTLHSAGQCVSAAGSRAAVGAANSAGTVASYRADALQAASDAAFVGRCAVTLFDADSSTVDPIVTRVLADAPAALVLVVGISETDRAAAHLHVAIAHGARFAAGVLTSASTRRADFVQLVDVAPTILASFHVAEPASMIGQTWRSTGPSSRDEAKIVARLRDLDRAARRQAAAIVPFFVTQSVLMVVVCALALLMATGRIRSRARGLVRVGCAAAALFPAASFLAGLTPWWRSSSWLLVLFGVTAGWVALATGAAVAVDRALGRRPFGLATAVGLITTAVIGIDLLTGAGLQIFTMNGYSPLVAGRFAGIGNVAFGVFGAAVLLAAGGLYERFGLMAVGTVGLLAVALDGGPSWGSDVGGVLALVPAFALLAWTLGGVRLSGAKLAGSLVGAVIAVGLLGVLDYARPAARQTHLGRFVGELLHGGAWTVVRRKALADFALLTHSFLTLLVPVLVVAAALLIRRPPGVLRLAFEQVPVLRPTLVAVIAMAVVAAVVNDSGAAIPALVVLVVLPAVTSVLPAVAPMASVTSVLPVDRHASGASDGEPPHKLLP